MAHRAGSVTVKAQAESDNDLLAARVVDRLRHDAPDYEWDASPIYHSSYDNFHVSGTAKSKKPSKASMSKGSTIHIVSSSDIDEMDFADNQPQDDGRKRVLARVSRHVLRLEREYKVAEKLGAELGPDQNIYVKVLELVRLPPRQPGEPRLVAMIDESPGRNHLIDMVELGAGFYRTVIPNPHGPAEGAPLPRRPTHQRTPLHMFLQFAVGAARALEHLHNHAETTHGDLRPDAFHWCHDSGLVRIINFGAGPRSFEHGLTSAGWSQLTSELGVEHKLQFIAPEQTGRMPAEPDNRTDIYSLGILFYIMLSDEPAFEGSSPLDIMQNALTRRLSPIDSRRPDVPQLLSRIIAKMVQKSMVDRYQSVTGLRHDLLECQRLLESGDVDQLVKFEIGRKDVQSTFTHPTRLIGGKNNLETIKRIIDHSSARSATRVASNRKGISGSRQPLGSSERNEISLDGAGTESTTSLSKEREQAISTGASPEAAKRQNLGSATSQDLTNFDGMVDTKQSSLGRNSIASNEFTSGSLNATIATGNSIPISKESLLRTAQNLRKHGICEIITVSGNAGLGKTTLLHNVQAYAREAGYFASAKFSSSTKTPFEATFKAMSSLFRQIFSERDVYTDLHEQVRQVVGPVWDALHTVLELPPWLVSQYGSQNGSSTGGGNHSPGAATKKNDAASSWLNTGGSVRDARFVSTFMDFLRILVMHNSLCLCFEDLQYADDDSLDLLHSIISAGIPIVMILTFRGSEKLPAKTRQLIDNSTQITLRPFTEEQTSEYVTEMLHRPAHYLLPLVAVLHQKTGGTPFLIREFLDQCHRQKSIFYSFKSGRWEVNMDQIFQHFSAANNEELNTDDYIVRRLSDLSTDAKTLLCWASLVGQTFTFTLMSRVIVCDCSKRSPVELLPTRAKDAVSGLQAALASFAIMPTDEEDTFRFSHDRYMSAISVLRKPFYEDEMHFVLASAMMKHDPWQPGRPTQLLFDQSRHICSAIPVIRKRAITYRPFREQLYVAAQTAQGQGARKIALYYLKHCLTLLAEDIWNVDDKKADVTYPEILTLLTQTAGLYWYLEDYESASTIVKEIFDNTDDPYDRSAAHVLQGRIYTQQGNSRGAFECMKGALKDLGHACSNLSWDECDAQFQELVPLLIEKQPDTSNTNVEVSDRLITTGAVIVELISAAFW